MLTRLGLAIFFSMNVMVFTMALWTWDAYPVPPGSSVASLRELFRHACLLFAAPVLLLLGGPLLESAWESLKKGRITTDLLMVVGVATAFLYSALALTRGDQHVYFEVGCMILVAVTLGRWLEATGKLRASRALQSLQKLMPDTARRLIERTEQQIPLADVQQGDLIRILAGERIPVDGHVEGASTTIDEQIVTGENVPRTKQAGDAVYGGTLNIGSELLVRTSANGGQGTVQRMVAAVAQAVTTRSEEQRFADRLATWFVPVIAVVAMLTFTAQFWTNDVESALMSSLSVVLIACPCALGVATPLAVWAALGVAARNQVLVRNGDALSRLARVKSMFFDKTGTLTSGQVQLARRQYATKGVAPEADRLACALASRSIHVLSQSLTSELAKIDLGELPELTNVMDVPGRGIAARLTNSGIPVWLGSRAFAVERGVEFPESTRRDGEDVVADESTSTCVGKGERVLAIYRFQERVRPEAHATITQMRELGIDLGILTGDQEPHAEAIGRQLGIEARAELMPEDKLVALKNASKRLGPVAMVGDGINDAPALASADVGITMDCGADISRDAADICLLGSRIDRLPWMIRLARDTKRTIHLNIFWSMAYNVVGVGLAAWGYLNPVFAAVAMVGSSFFVVANSLQLVGRNEQNWTSGLPDGSFTAANQPTDPRVLDDGARNGTTNPKDTTDFRSDWGFVHQ